MHSSHLHCRNLCLPFHRQQRLLYSCRPLRINLAHTITSLKHLQKPTHKPRLRFAWRRREVCRALTAEPDEEVELSKDEIEDLISDAAGFICVMDELRPLDSTLYNPFYEIWTRIERIPPHARHRLLDELEPGSLRNLWRASMARYVLDEARSLRLFSGVSVWDDYPTEPGQVFTYKGRCERYELEGPEAVQFSASGPPDGAPGSPSVPWLQATPGSFETPVTRFTQSFFVPPLRPLSVRELQGAEGRQEEGEEEGEEAAGGLEAGEPRVFSRVQLPLVGPLDRWWEPIYCRLSVGLTLTPLSRDAGADLLLLYPSDPECGYTNGDGEAGANGVPAVRGSGAAAAADDAAAAAAKGLASWPLVSREDVPLGAFWPVPEPESYSVSPFSSGPRDYMRVAGPGVYVGCAYRRTRVGEREEIREEDCVYFAIARKL